MDCLELGDGYECGLCLEPLVGDGMSCEPPGLCNPNPCYPGVICTPSNWHFSCAPCPSGMWGNGVNCFKNNSQDKICSGLNDNCKPSLCNSSNPDLCLNDNSLPTDSTFTPKRPMEPEKPLGRVEIAEKAPGRDKTMVKTTNRNGVSEKTSRLAEIQEETLKLSGVLEKPQEHVGISEVVSGHSLLDKTSGFTAKSPDPCKPNPCFTNVSCNVDSGYVICGNCPPGYKVCILTAKIVVKYLNISIFRVTGSSVPEIFAIPTLALITLPVTVELLGFSVILAPTDL